MKTKNRLTGLMMKKEKEMTKINDEATSKNCGDNKWESHHVSNSNYYQHRVVNLFGDFTPDAVNIIIEQLLVWEEEDAVKIVENSKLAEPIPDEYLLDPIIININSGGGNVDELFALVDVLEGMDAPIITRGFGKICSCAFALFCIGDERLIGPNCSLMYHQISGGYVGKLPDVSSYSEVMKDIQKRMRQIIMNKTGLKKKTIDTWDRVKTDKWMNAKEVVELGIATDFGC